MCRHGFCQICRLLNLLELNHSNVSAPLIRGSAVSHDTLPRGILHEDVVPVRATVRAQKTGREGCRPVRWACITCLRLCTCKHLETHDIISAPRYAGTAPRSASLRGYSKSTWNLGGCQISTNFHKGGGGMLDISTWNSCFLFCFS